MSVFAIVARAWLSFSWWKEVCSMFSLICAITGIAAWEAFSAGACIGAATYAVGKGIQKLK